MTGIATLAQLADLIGDDAAAELARAFGGETLCLPADPDQEPRLEKAIGALAASCLCEVMADNTITFPAPAKRRKARPAPKAKPTVSTGKGRVAAQPSTETGSKVLDDIASVIGQEATRKLAYEFMGQRIYIPKVPDTQPRIAQAIGPELAAKLCGAFWRLAIAFPVGLARSMRVLELVEKGETANAIARQLFMNERMVYRIMREHRERSA